MRHPRIAPGTFLHALARTRDIHETELINVFAA
jgi:hypothetical protein